MSPGSPRNARADHEPAAKASCGRIPVAARARISSATPAVRARVSAGQHLNARFDGRGSQLAVHGGGRHPGQGRVIAARHPELQRLLNTPQCRSERCATVGKHGQKVRIQTLTVLDRIDPALAAASAPTLV